MISVKSVIMITLQSGGPSIENEILVKNKLAKHFKNSHGCQTKSEFFSIPYLSVLSQNTEF